MSVLKRFHLAFYFIIFTTAVLVSPLVYPSTSSLVLPVASPWGKAKVLDIKYKPQKVFYDLTTGDPDELDNVLDRASALFKLYDSDLFESSIVIIIHGDAIAFFATENFSKFKQHMQRANSLTMGTTIEFRMCNMAAKMMNYSAEDIHGFVSMVPMADAEMVRLQNEEGYAYMR